MVEGVDKSIRVPLDGSISITGRVSSRLKESQAPNGQVVVRFFLEETLPAERKSLRYPMVMGRGLAEKARAGMVLGKEVSVDGLVTRRAVFDGAHSYEVMEILTMRLIYE